MIYDLPSIEKIQIEKAQKNKLYKVERDRLKPRYFLYTNYPKINYYGLNIAEAKRFVYSDFIVRYQRLIGKNVLFSMGYNNLDSSIYHNANILDKPLYNIVDLQYKTYQKELSSLEISFDNEKEIIYSNANYIRYVQEVFLQLYEKKIISLKHGLVVHNGNKIFQKGEYYEENGRYVSNSGEKLKHTYSNYYALSLKNIKTQMKSAIDNLELPQTVKLCLLDSLRYRNELVIKCRTTADEILEINMMNPEFICGISYVSLNPKYIDIKPFISSDECGDYEELLNNISDELLYTGTFLINPIINNKIPVFVSYKFDEGVHVGIPSLSDSEENFVLKNELDFNPILDYINDECVLVNSGRFNGLSLLEAHDAITNSLVEEGLATKLKDVKLDELIVSSKVPFGVPIPLHMDNSKAKLPVIYDIVHDVKLEDGELPNKTLVKEFICDEFVNHLLPNAIRLKSDTGIIEFDSQEAYEELGIFKYANMCVLDSNNYLQELLWNVVFDCLFYEEGKNCELKNTLFIKPIVDKNSLTMSRENSNLISVGDLIETYGSTIVRSYYAAIGNITESTIYDVNDINKLTDVINNIIKVFYYPIDDMCVELDIAYQRFIDSANMSARKYDFKTYFEEIVKFVKKVHEIKHISRAQAKGLLIVLSVIAPSLAEQLKQDVLNLREPLYYYSWPE